MLKVSLLIQATERVTGPLRRVRAGIRGMVENGERDIRRLDRAMERLNGAGQRMIGMGKTMSLGLTLPLAAFGVKAFEAASDAQELQSAHDQTFGKMAGAMNRWADNMGNALGRSSQEMQKATLTFGMFFNQAAPPGKAARMSATFARLAQDLGSFHNIDTGTAIEKLRAGLSGESEPLRQLGVFLDETKVKAKALAMGLVKPKQELSEQAKITARYALILESTKNAQGDLTRTQGSAANQIKRSQAAWGELSVAIGTKLLPHLTPLITKLGSVLDRFNKLSPSTQRTIVVVAGPRRRNGTVARCFRRSISRCRRSATRTGQTRPRPWDAGRGRDATNSHHP